MAWTSLGQTPPAGRTAPAALPSGRTVAVAPPVGERRRRVASVMAGTTAGLIVVAAVSGLVALWGVAAFAGALTLAYAAAAGFLGRRAAARELRAAFGMPRDGLDAPDWGGLDPHLRVQDFGGLAAEPVAETWSAAAATRFLAAYFAALALTPLVFFLRLVSGDLSDIERHRLIGRLMRFQGYWRSQSLRMLTVGVAATATVGIAGASTGTAFAASYTVRAGDTLGSIAAANGTTVSALAAANELANPNILLVGQVLDLSGSGSASSSGGATSSSSSGSYTVQAGDTLASIAAAHGTTVSALAAANGIADPNMIMVGQVLDLSGGGSSPTAAVTAASVTSSSSSSGSYTVQAGDTLASIAAAHGTTVSALAAANGIADPNMIMVGQVLNLSGGGSSVSAASGSTMQQTWTPTGTPSNPTPAIDTSVTVSAPSGGAAAVQAALGQVGVPYVYGGASPGSGFDCSGLVMYAWGVAGVSLPHNSVSQYDDTTRISESDLEPGDIVFYDTGDGAQPGHEALYIGNGQVVAANNTGTLVQTQSITYDGTPMGFGRVA